MASIFSGRAGRLAANYMAGKLEEGKQEAYGALDKAQTGANDLYGRAQGRYTPLSDIAGRGMGLYADAMGLNGADGNARASGAFQAGPGYQFALDQGSQAALRGAAAGGQLASGNTLMALNRYGQGLANQEYGSWLNNLGGYNAMGQNVAGAQAGLDTGLAEFGLNVANNKAQIGTNAAQGIASAGAGGLMAGQQAAANRMNFGLNVLTGLGNLAKGFM
jgi:hypothetical protein